jgi:hypothetical protein
MHSNRHIVFYDDPYQQGNVFCFLSSLPLLPPSHHGRDWLLPVISRSGPPHPHPQESVAPQGGSHTRMQGKWRGGGPIPTMRQTLWYSRCYNPSTTQQGYSS